MSTKQDRQRAGRFTRKGPKKVEKPTKKQAKEIEKRLYYGSEGKPAKYPKFFSRYKKALEMARKKDEGRLARKVKGLFKRRKKSSAAATMPKSKTAVTGYERLKQAGMSDEQIKRLKRKK